MSKSRIKCSTLSVTAILIAIALSGGVHAADADEITSQSTEQSFSDRHAILSLLELASRNLKSGDTEGRRHLATAYAALGQEQSLEIAAGNNVGLREVAVNLGKYGALDMAKTALRKIEVSEFGNYQRLIAYCELSRFYIDKREIKRASECVDELCKVLPLLNDYRSNGYWHSKLSGDVASLCLEVGRNEEAYEIAQGLILRSQRNTEKDEQIEMLAVASSILVQGGHEAEAVAIGREIESAVYRSEILIAMTEGFLTREKYCSALKVIDETNRHRTRAQILIMIAAQRPGDLDCDNDLQVLDAAEAEAKACFQERGEFTIQMLTEIATLHASNESQDEASRIFSDILKMCTANEVTVLSQQAAFGSLGKTAVVASELRFSEVAKQIFKVLEESADRETNIARRNLKLSLIIEYQSDAGLCEDADKTLQRINDQVDASRVRLQIVRCLGRQGKISTADVVKSISDHTQRKLALGVLADVYLEDERPSLALEALTLRYGSINRLPAFHVFQIAQQMHREEQSQEIHSLCSRFTDQRLRAFCALGVAQVMLRQKNQQ